MQSLMNFTAGVMSQNDFTKLDWVLKAGFDVRLERVGARRET